MIIAAADVKPDRTGNDKKCTRNPRRNMKNAKKTIPTQNPRAVANGAFSSGVVAPQLSVAVFTINDTSASGPHDNYTNYQYNPQLATYLSTGAEETVHHRTDESSI